MFDLTDQFKVPLTSIEQKATEKVRITERELELLCNYASAADSFFFWQKQRRTRKADKAWQQTCANHLKAVQAQLSAMRRNLTQHSIRPDKLKLAVAKNARLWQICVIDFDKE